MENKTLGIVGRIIEEENVQIDAIPNLVIEKTNKGVSLFCMDYNDTKFKRLSRNH